MNVNFETLLHARFIVIIQNTVRRELVSSMRRGGMVWTIITSRQKKNKDLKIKLSKQGCQVKSAFFEKTG